jgi:PBP1b-binding outer membrane lipoprotein LpoB
MSAPRAAVTVMILTVLFLAGCATDRPAQKKEPAPERTVFDSPDVDSLH